MDSSGIGVLAGRYRKISCFGGKVYVIHANRRIRKILEMSGIGDIVEDDRSGGKAMNNMQKEWNLKPCRKTKALRGLL